MKKHITVTFSLVKNFNRTIKELQIDEKTFNEDAYINYTLHRFSDKLTIVVTKLRFLHIAEKQMESYKLFEESIDKILMSIIFARLQIIQRSIISPSFHFCPTGSVSKFNYV